MAERARDRNLAAEQLGNHYFVNLASVHSGSQIDMEVLRDLPVLRKPGFGCPTIADEDLAIIGKLRHLEWLDLSFTQVTDDGLKQLSELDKLRVLYLGGTSVTDVGAAELEAALPACQIVR